MLRWQCSSRWQQPCSSLGHCCKRSRKGQCRLCCGAALSYSSLPSPEIGRITQSLCYSCFGFFLRSVGLFCVDLHFRVTEMSLEFEAVIKPGRISLLVVCLDRTIRTVLCLCAIPIRTARSWASGPCFVPRSVCLETFGRSYGAGKLTKSLYGKSVPLILVTNTQQ